jgi:hypothetical protein
MSTFVAVTWPEAVLYLGLVFAAITVVGGAAAVWTEFRTTRIKADQEDDLRQLVHRYEQLSENSLDAQQRVATDLSEMRTRVTAIEQILRTVE